MGDWTTVAAAAVGALAGMSGGTLVEAYKRRRDRVATAYALAAAVRASVAEVRQFKVVEALTGMAAKLDRDPDASFTDGKRFQDPPSKYNLTVFEKHIDRLGLVSPGLAEPTILWFSAYAGFQHALWHVLHRCDTNKQASAVIGMLVPLWGDAEASGKKLADDLVGSVGRWPL